jgi:hypothetical protein
MPSGRGAQVSTSSRRLANASSRDRSTVRRGVSAPRFPPTHRATDRGHQVEDAAGGGYQHEPRHELNLPRLRVRSRSGGSLTWSRSGRRKSHDDAVS